MSGLDWGILTAYLVAIVAFGVWAGRGHRHMDDFFLAGRQMRWWAVGLSVMATQISAITFVSTTGQAYTDGMRFLVFYFGLPFAMVVLCMTLVPFFYRARVFTAYEYLERRFDGKTRTLTSVLFLLSRGLAVGVTLYAPSVVLSTLLGWSEAATILLMGGTTIAYVFHGGNKSVIWTDVAQMALIWLGILACFGVAWANLPAGITLRDGLALAKLTGRLDIMNPSPSLTTPYTLWGGLLAGFFLMLSYFGCDQSQVQRYLAGRSLTESRLSLLFNAFLKVPMQFLILLTGVLVFVFYHFERPPLLWNRVELARFEAATDAPRLADLHARFDAVLASREKAARGFVRSRDEGAREEYLAAEAQLASLNKEIRGDIQRQTGARYNDTNYVFLTYVLGHLPRGLVGLVIAVIFAAGMSTLSGEFNSLATTTMVDFVQRFRRREASASRDLLLSRVFTALWGGFACVVALQAGRLGSAIEVVNTFGSYFYGSILGVFALAVLAPRVTGTGAFVGLLCGMGAVGLVSAFTNVHFLWLNVVGAGTVFLIGRLVTAVSPGTKAAT